MTKRTQQEKMRLLVLTGLFAALICLFTAYICHIPMGANGGYLHFGDTLIYVAAALLPQPYALLAAAIGGGLADLLTAPMWAPATIIIKALITLPFTWKAQKLLCTRNRIAPFISWIISTIGYYLAGRPDLRPVCGLDHVRHGQCSAVRRQPAVLLSGGWRAG